MSFALRPRFPWQLRTRSLALGERTLVMAIVNLTPDSFSGDGLSARGITGGIDAALAAFDAGADIVDLGAESTRPNAAPLSVDAELARLLPVLEGVRKQRPDALLSVDTYHALTAREAARAGAEIINDVSGLLWDAQMPEAVAATGCGLVLMHTRGRPQEWPTQPRLAPDEVLPTVLAGLSAQLDAALDAGIAEERIVLDPGFGFGKIGRENFPLLAHFADLHQLRRPLLAGVSRKGFVGEAVRDLHIAAPSLQDARRVPTVAANTAAILAGAHLIRVHDVREAREAAAVADRVMESLVVSR